MVMFPGKFYIQLKCTGGHSSNFTVLVKNLRGLEGKNVENINFFLFVFTTPKFCLLSRAATKIHGIFTYFMIFGFFWT